MEEIWKDIKGYENLYQVSNIGRVKSLERIIINSLGRKKTVKERILKQTKHKAGYYRIGLDREGKRKNYLVHRLVAQAFIPNPYNLPECNHKDENPLNNCIENLEWCDHKYNINYGTRTERASEKMKGHIVSQETRNKISKKIEGENHPNYGKYLSQETRNKIGNANRNGKCSKSVLQYDLDGNLIAEFPSTMEVERQLGFNSGNISMCCLNKPKYKTYKGFIWKYKESVA